MYSRCTICGTQVAGTPDDDRTCPDCEAANFPVAPDQAALTARSLEWYVRERASAPRGLRALHLRGAWTWSPEHGIEETPGAH